MRREGLLSVSDAELELVPTIGDLVKARTRSATLVALFKSLGGGGEDAGQPPTAG